MQLRTFSAATSAEVLAKIKAELGADAVILDTQEENGMICMTAALERPHTQMRKASASTSYAAASNFNAGDMFPVATDGGQLWQEEWNSIRTHLLALMKPALQLDALAPRQRLAIEFLQREGVDDECIVQLFSALRGKKDASVLEPLESMVCVAPWSATCWTEQVQFLTGPFGAGKTSAAIRLALLLKKESPDLRVCLVNADATRGNGRLLLRHYCKLSDLDYKEASSTLELVAAIDIAKREGYDRILVDLPGLSRGKMLHSVLQDAGFGASHAQGVAVHLVLPPLYDPLQLRTMLARYKSNFRGSIVWTKLDEAEHFGQLVNVAVQTRLPVSAVSFGAGMGNSLLPVQANMIWRLLFKKELPR